ncbi:MAG: DUF6573 family protein [Anaerolineales bacterium]
MARLRNAEVMGYFPTPPTVTTLIARWLKAPGAEDGCRWRLLDPCAGEGAAARQLVDTLGGNVESWGVELSPQRAARAAEVLDKVYNTAWQSTRASKESVSLLYLNPPYDFDLDGEDRRLEIEFLRRTVNTLIYGGVLVYIIPRRILGYLTAVRMLAGHFENVVVRRFPEGEYERFNQVVVFAQRKRYQTPTQEAVEAIRSLYEAEILPLDDPPADSWPVTLPCAPLQARFYRTDVSPQEQVQAAYRAGWAPELLEALAPQEARTWRPLWPLKQGHTAMAMSSGLLDVLSIRQNDRPLIVKGRVVKRQREYTEKDTKGNQATIIRDYFVTEVGVVSSDGVEVIDDVQGLTEFMETYGEAVGREILKNPPLYNLEPRARDWQQLGTLGRSRKPLPGQKEPGLLDVQKHAALALSVSCKNYGSAVMQGEMGLGKTTIALATIDLLDAYPALVLCPPQLVNKWRREAAEVIPGVQTRELRRIGKEVGEEYDVNDVRRFFTDYEQGLLGEKAVAVVAETSAKLGAGWAGAMATRYRLPDEQRFAFRQAYEAYEEARQALLHARKGGAPKEDLERWRREVAQLRRAALETAQPYPVCPGCGKVYFAHPRQDAPPEPEYRFKAFDKKPLYCEHVRSGWALDTEERIAHNDEGEPLWAWVNSTPEGLTILDDSASDLPPDVHPPTCRAPLFEFGAHYRRWPIADYIRLKHPSGFKMLIADEVHQFKGKSSDRALAFHRLIGATRYQLSMTGTLYGGTSTSIFYILQRLSMGGTQRDFAYGAEMEWARRYGVLETRTYGGRGDDADDYGANNATKRRRSYTREQPGVSPAILERLIGNTIFLSLPDLGVALPGYAEEVVLLDQEAEQGGQYEGLESYLRAIAREDRRYLSTWLQWSLSRPNSAFRDEEVIKLHRNDDGEVIKEETLKTLPAVVSAWEPQQTAAIETFLPKEKWLVDYCNAEARAGRKVIVYVRQTGERDIQPRLKAVLEQAGLRTTILGAGVSTRRREAWIRKRAPSLDVLIVNPRLVEVGLDLIQFATIIFYELDYSLYTMWQAMRRVWRLGQHLPVKVIYAVYKNTLEAKAMALMGKKMKAAQLLYGDEVGGAIVPEEEGDFLQELARSVLEEKQLPDLTLMFAEARQATESALGCPTAVSPQLRISLEEFRARHEEALEARRAKKHRRAVRRRRSRDLALVAVGASQPSLFGSVESLGLEQEEEADEREEANQMALFASSEAPSTTEVAAPGSAASRDPEPFVVIHTYTRAEALEDGVLIDVSEMAREAGFKWPVAVSAAVWHLIEDIPPRFAKLESVKGRLWDVLWMARCAIKPPKIEGLVLPEPHHDDPYRLLYSLILHHGNRTYARLKLLTGPGDDGEPVVTILLPDED